MPDRPSPKRRAQDVLARLETIRETEDRSQSFVLLDLLVSGLLDDDRAADVSDVLVLLEDPRCAPALRHVALDGRRSVAVRAAAIEILSATPCDDPERREVRGWAQSHDPLVRALGVQYLDVPDGDLIAAAAGDPEPVVRRVAVEAMASLVRTPALVAALRRALRDEDALVREVACRVALFDEPLETSWELLRALSDPSVVVRAAAFDALEWFPRVSVLLALADARASAGEPGPADTVLGVLSQRVLATSADASPAARKRLERWAGPVAWLLAETGTEESPGLFDVAGSQVGPRTGGVPTSGPAADVASARAVPPRRRAAARIDVPLAERALLDADTPPTLQRELLVRRSWAKCGRRGLDVLRACIASSNWALRQMAARPLADNRATDELLLLARDREAVVRRAAFVAALDLDSCGDGVADGRFLAAARDALRDPWMRPTTGDHALALVAAHARPDEVEAVVLDELSRPDDRDGLFLGAIHLARLAGFARAAPPLLALVNAPVISSVAAHVAALQALRSLGHPRSRIDLAHLDGVDHLDVQRELGEWGWHGVRW